MLRGLLARLASIFGPAGGSHPDAPAADIEVEQPRPASMPPAQYDLPRATGKPISARQSKKQAKQRRRRAAKQ